jgi:hypothetical protein
MGVGSHQFHRASAAISDGTSSARTIVASTRIAFGAKPAGLVGRISALGHHVPAEEA